MAPLTHTDPELELSGLRSELHSIESLLDDVLQRQSLLLSRLDQLQRGASSNGESPTPGPSSGLPLPWVDVVRKRRRISLPLFSPEDVDDPLPTSNFFTPLSELAESTELAATRPLTATKQPIEVGPKRAKKRPNSPSSLPASHGKRRRCSSPHAAFNPEFAPASQGQPPVPLLDQALGSVVASRDIIIPSCVSPGEPVAAPPPTATIDTRLPLSSKLSFFKGVCKDGEPEILIIGDSIIRYVEIPGAHTYCLSGGKIIDMLELAPALIDLYPSAHTLIFHVCTNDVMSRQSAKLRFQLESLAITIQSLGKTFIFSGPIPAPSKGPEHFSRLWSIHEWMKTFCIATGNGFISNFDCFWTRVDLYKSDGLHLNAKGSNQLNRNLIQFIAFNTV